MHFERTDTSFVQIKNPILVIGGFLSTHEDFELMVHEIKKFLNPVVILLPEGDFPTVLDKIRAFIESTFSHPIPVIGYSMGGRVALELLDQFPDLFSHVICISSRLKLEGFESKKREEFEKEVHQKLKNLEMDPFLKWWYSLPIFAGYSPNESLLRVKAQFDPRTVLKQFQTLSIMNQKTHSFPFKLSVHLIYGEKDPLKKEMEDCLKESLEPIFIHSIEKSGHLVHLEKPLQLAKLLRKVLL
jgi:2-succinyl-6-hydroxy-2,4-cyclohexadiene-1-carboxylate synthase